MRDFPFNYSVHKKGRFFKREYKLLLSFCWNHGDVINMLAGHSYTVWNPFWWSIMPFTNPKLFINQPTMKSNPSCQSNCIRDAIESGMCECYNNDLHPECREEKWPTKKCVIAIALMVVIAWSAILCLAGNF